MSASANGSASGSFRPGARKASITYSSPLYFTVTRSAPRSGSSCQRPGRGTGLAGQAAKDRMPEPFGLDDGPLFQAVPREVDLVDGFFVPGVGVQPLFAHRLVKLIHLVWNLELRRQL